MKKKETIKQLQKKANKLLIEIRKQKDEKTMKVQIPFLKSLVGTCYVYHGNSYGRDSEKWDVFRRILDYVQTRGSFYFIYEEVFVDCNGKAVLSVEYEFAHLNVEWHEKDPFSGFVKCDLKEYNSAKEMIVEEMRSQNKIRQELKKL